MALKPCKSCKHLVDPSAKTCPNCGVSKPGVSAKEQLIGTLILLAIIGVVFAKCSGSDSDSGKESASPTPKTAKVDDATCKADLQCWGDKNSVGASVYCKDPVSRLAKYSFRWTDGTFETKFSHFRWLNKGKGTVTYIGDKIEFQNGFGAYQSHVYECDFDPASNTVLAVRAQPGRL
ncbi:hypothetical protein [Pseudomonas benzopyrenica]|uniref:hypothetical protein n=1 Tax=Pseudomonas benzopyrenica TaxID=2993566 RepID=UPI00227E0F15|nr:hypothetical protein [Pseudomonas benzopyrenica]MDC7831626.1 hypothetical protein [Pseudomonas benzopyrenica]